MQDKIKNSNTLATIEKNSCEMKVNDTGIKIKKVEGKECIDKRFGMPLEEKTSPKYYFEKDGKRISRDYYSIEPLDDIHYIVSDLDFMYSLGFDEWESIYGNEFTNVDYYNFKFHKGIVAIIGNEVIEVVPTIYNDLKPTNSHVIFTKGDPIYKGVYDTNGKFVKTVQEPDKIGCINLDINSEYYSWTIVPMIFDSIIDFDLEFEGFAHAYIGEYDGYISKEMDIERYKDFMCALTMYKNKIIDYSTYKQHLSDYISKILLSKEEVVNLINGKQSNGTTKKIGEIPKKKKESE